jgi:hypothetical protein
MSTYVHEWAMLIVHSREYTAGKLEILLGEQVQLWRWTWQSR